MTVQELNENFGLAGAKSAPLFFDEHEGLTRAQVRLDSAEATVYLHGAHVTHWQPAGAAPVLFLSPGSEFAADKAIRGGVPLCWPWFGPRGGGEPGPAHGFARTQEWTLAFAALLPSGDGDRMHLTFTLGPTDESRSLGFDQFRVAYEVIVGANLTLRLSVANLGERPLHFEEALHAYFAVSDVRNISLSGLEGARYRDKTDAMREKAAPDGPLRLTAETDRVFPAHTAAVTILDPGSDASPVRSIRIEKAGSETTVVWNPWKKLADVPEEAWARFVCVETANTATEAVTLAAGQTHTMQCTLSVN